MRYTLYTLQIDAQNRTTDPQLDGLSVERMAHSVKRLYGVPPALVRWKLAAGTAFSRREVTTRRSGAGPM